ncbi:MAG: hypothetical protein V2A56_05465 [bacterium]
MDEQGNTSSEHPEEQPVWEAPEILEQGHVEARLFSDEPDPWGGP